MCFMAACALHPALAGRVHPRARALAAAALAGSEPEDPQLQAQVAITMAIDGLDRTAVRRLASRALDAHPLVDAGAITALGFAMGALVYVDELETAERAAAAALEHAERRGAIVAASAAHQRWAMVLLHSGRLAEAALEAERGLEVHRLDWETTAELNTTVLILARLELGDLEGARAALELAQPSGGTRLVTVLEARGRLRLVEGDAKAALADLRAAGELYAAQYGVCSPGVSTWRSEAAVAAPRLGDVEEARRLAAEELELARACGVPRAIGIALTASALVAGSPRDVEPLREAVATLEHSTARLEYARALTELGAALRRDRQRTAARATLRRALALADGLGAATVAARAREELLVAGARPRRAAISGVEALTASERRVAELVADGLSNAQIAGQLVVTRKTVEWHIGGIFRKLDISSRDELAATLQEPVAD